MTSESTSIAINPGNHQNTSKCTNTQVYKVQILGLDISHLEQRWQFIICSLGVFYFYLLYGYFQELIFLQPGIKSQGLYLTFYQFALYSIFALLESRMEKSGERRIPIKTYVAISFLTVATMAFSNSSLEYLNYPTQVIFKSCKLIPVLVGGIIIQKKKYGPADFAAAAVMCIGLVWFTLADSSVSPNFHFAGILMISLALLADAVIGNVQEKAMKTFGASNSEMVLYSYSIGLIFLGIALILSGQIFTAVRIGYEHPLQLYGYGFLFSLTGYLGVNLVLTLVRTTGAFAAVTVTTCRKALSMAISFLAFTKPFTIQYVWSGMLVLLGIYLNILGKQQSAWKQSMDLGYYKILELFQSLPFMNNRSAAQKLTMNV